MRLSERSLRVEVLRTLEDARSLTPLWWDVLGRAVDRTPFVGPDWMIAWWVSFSSPGDQMHLVTVWDGARLVAIAPLLFRPERHRGRERRVLGFWCNAYSNRVAPVVDEDYRSDALGCLAEHILEMRSDWDATLLRDVQLSARTTTTLVGALASLGARAGLERGHASPYLPLPATFAEVEASLSAQFRETLRRKARAADRCGFRAEISDDPSRMEDVLSVCRGSWQHANGTGIGSTSDARSFYERLAESMAGRGGLQLALLMDGDTPIAFEYNLLIDGCLSNLRMGYRMTARRHSPGLVLRRYTIGEAIRLGATEFDFLGASEEHKRHWTSQVRRLGSIVVYSDRGLDPLRHIVRHRIRPWVEQKMPGVAPVARRAYRLARPRAGSESG